MINAFGRNYEEIGSSDKGLILKNSGKVKIQWGKSFIDLIDRNGNINSQAGNLLRTVQFKDSISDDGFYFVTNTGELVVKINGNVSTITTTSETLYISFMEEQQLTSDQKYTALKNIGFIYDNVNNIQEFPKNGIVYNEEDEQLYIIKNGNLINKYSPPFQNNIEVPLTLYSPLTIDIQNILDEEGSIIIKNGGKSRAISFDSLKIYTQGSQAIFDIDGDFIIKTQTINGEKEILKLHDEKLIVDQIGSFRTTNRNSKIGYNIYFNNEDGKYQLDINQIYVKDNLSFPEKIIPTKIYNKENVILSIEQSYYSDNDINIDGEISIDDTEEALNNDNPVAENGFGSLYKAQLKYENEYVAGNILRFYIEIDYEYGKIQYPILFNVLGIRNSDNIIVGTISYTELLLQNENDPQHPYSLISDDTILKQKNLLCQLFKCSSDEKNQDLVIGNINGFDKTYNNKNFGIISKQNILYSAKFATDKSIQENNGVTSLPQIEPEEFPYYDNLLTNILQTKYSNTTVSEENTENNITCVEALNIISSLPDNVPTQEEYTILGYIYGAIGTTPVLNQETNTYDNVSYFTISDSQDTQSSLVVWDFTYSTGNLETTYNSGDYLVQVTGNLQKYSSNSYRVVNPTVRLIKEYYSSYGEYNLPSDDYDNVLVPYRLFRDLKSDMDKLKWKLDHTQVVYRSILRDLISSITGN